MKLTEKKIFGLAVAAGQRDRLIFDDEQGGLAVRVTASGSKSYLVQYTAAGRKFRVPLGSTRSLSLGQAREATKAIIGEVALGKNPAMDRKAGAARDQEERERQALTLELLIAEWERLHLSARRRRYSTEAVRALRVGLLKHLGQPAESLSRRLVVVTLDGLPGQMSARTGAYGRACYGWAMKRGMVADNPFKDLPARKATLRRERVLTLAELKAIWETALSEGGRYGDMVRMLMLTGQRRDEVSCMAWSELSDDFAMWLIPGTRTKNGLPHYVPLSPLVRDIIRKREDEANTLELKPNEWPLVFSVPLSKKPYQGWSKAKVSLDEMSKVTAWRLHDLRRTVATGLQSLGVRLEVTEAVLNHTSGTRGGIAGVYQRHDWADEKKAALDLWATHLMAMLAATSEFGQSAKRK